MKLLLKNREMLLVVAIIALLALIALRFPPFVAPGNLANVYNDTSILIILALGQMAVILTRCIDLSMAANLALSGMAAAMLPNAKGAAARLFAFGYDAWRITAYLEHLATSAEGIAGATGVLRIDGFGNVQRTPAWSTFSGGIAVPLADAARR